MNVQLQPTEATIESTHAGHVTLTISQAELRDRRQFELQRMQDNMLQLHARKGRPVDVVGSIRHELDVSPANRPTVEMRSGRSDLSNRKLTKREVAVLRLVASGLLNKEIARQLGISYWTVRNHLTAVFSKLGVSNRTEAVLHAVRSGFFSL